MFGIKVGGDFIHVSWQPTLWHATLWHAMLYTSVTLSLIIYSRQFQSDTFTTVGLG